MKVWTDSGGNRFMVSMGQFNPRKGIVHAFIMSEERTTQIQLSPDEWNALPFYYFKEDGLAPHKAEKWPLTN
jgi:hypothetical protein